MEDNSNTLLGFLSVCCPQEELKEEEDEVNEEIFVYRFISSMPVVLESRVRDTVSYVRTKRWIRELYKAKMEIVRPPQNCELRGFVVRARESVQ